MTSVTDKHAQIEAVGELGLPLTSTMCNFYMQNSYSQT